MDAGLDLLLELHQLQLLLPFAPRHQPSSPVLQVGEEAVDGGQVAPQFKRLQEQHELLLLDLLARVVPAEIAEGFPDLHAHLLKVVEQLGNQLPVLLVEPHLQLKGLPPNEVIQVLLIDAFLFQILQALHVEQL